MESSFIVTGLLNAISPYNILFIVLGTTLGLVVGALPGLSATMALALLLPLTFQLPPETGLCMMAALYLAAMYGGSIAAIILRTPGTPAAAATVMDGFPMGARGEAGRALGISLTASLVGGVFSGIALLTAAPFLGRLVLLFGPVELFAIAVLGITMIGTLSKGSSIKGLLSGAIGLLLSTVGMDSTSGTARFTFDNINLYSGIPFTVALIGLFSIPQAIALAEQSRGVQQVANQIRDRVLPHMSEFLKLLPNIIRSSAIGIVTGVIPGTGGDTASWFAYNEAKRFAKDKSGFGKGEPAGIAAPEAANNAVVGGALIPTIALGIPGSSTTAVLLGGLMVHGILPGPTLLTEHGAITYTLIWAVILANIPLFIIGLGMTRLCIYVTLVPKMVVALAIVVLSIIGALAINNNMFDVWLMLGFGALGYVFDRAKIPTAPLVIGLVLGALLDSSLAQSLLIGYGSWDVFLKSPIAAVLLLIALLSILQATPFFRMFVRKQAVC
ncbi:tripartite tricarboxylate transporter permease [Pseudomonas sp. Q11]|uniref:tripartite tricarboxylate transporter permease n=1 Tax=Pseudomonas sp. Q11 TaxID=2968470 RepID=UPI00210F1E67|nr:tripartite tricarboxylate transporter permease [Pseudomonas sp. Q11]MCQ6258287.1 tripartite tricarboxylate transporter permease [Pseudomonas sp. Q11]